jgi:hypothetical protein
MTRRFGYWIVGTALGMAQLGGCVHGGRSTPCATQDDSSQLTTFWQRQFQGHSGRVITQDPTPENRGPLDGNIAAPRDGDAPGTSPTTKTTETIAASPGPSAATAPQLMPPAVSSLPKAVPAQAALLPPTRLESQAEPSPAVLTKAEPSRREPLVEALQCFFEDRSNEALQFLRNYDQPTQEIAMRLLPILKIMTQKPMNQFTPTEVAVLNDQVQSLSDSLRPFSSLAIDKAWYCQRLESFGNYQPLPEGEGHAFLSSTSNRPGDWVQLCVELRNLANEFKNGVYTTKLSSVVEILDQNGTRVWNTDPFDKEKEPIQSRTPLRDCSTGYGFRVPSNLPVGRYTLVIRVTDQTWPDQPRQASKRLMFRVTSIPSRGP